MDSSTNSQTRSRSWSWLHTLLVSALFAAIVWVLSPLLTGHKEPWDAPGHYYPLALLIAGLLSGACSPRIRWAFYTGAILGQLAYAWVFLPVGPLIVVGVITLCIYGIVFLLAALLAGYLRQRALVMLQKQQ